MDTDQLILMCQIAIVILIFVIAILVLIYFLATKKSNKVKEEKKVILSDSTDINNKVKISDYGRFKENLSEESIFNFMEFDEIIDNMIIRKNKSQYIMVLQCNGVNYDLMSENEKVAVEEGFVQFLNTLRFPIQLYVQSRTLNLKDIVQDYKNRVDSLAIDIEKLGIKIKQAVSNGNKAMKEKLEFERRRKNNVLEYGLNIIEYVERMSSNKNILQQKTYVIIPYYTLELGGNLENFSKDEIDGMCFSELYTRAQNIASALGSSEISCRILDSEELAELLYVAYNRDDSELYQLSKAIDAQYDSLYSTGKDVLEKRQQMLDEEMAVESIDLATESILRADRRSKLEQEKKDRERKEQIKQKALNLVEEYKDQLSSDVYNYTIDEIDKYGESEKKQTKEKTPVKRKVVKRKPIE